MMKEKLAILMKKQASISDGRPKKVLRSEFVVNCFILEGVYF